MTQKEATKTDGRIVRGEATREKVLDAAERLFADIGFDGVSIRQIAQEAGVTLGMVGFHGGSKAELFETIVERRVSILSEERRKALAQLYAAPQASPNLRDIVAAYVRPYVGMASSGDPQWQAYTRLIAHLVSDERWYPRVKDHYDPVAREYLEAIVRIHPGIDRTRLASAFVMAVSSMLSIVASTVRISSLSDQPGRMALLPLEDVLVDFCSGGIASACHIAPQQGRQQGGGILTR